MGPLRWILLLAGLLFLAALAAWALLSLASLMDLAQNWVGLPGRATPWALLIVAATWCALTISARRVTATGLQPQQRSAVA